MTPFETYLLLWYYDPTNVPRPDWQHGRTRGLVRELCNESGLLTKTSELNVVAAFDLTEKGKFYVEHLLSAQLPVQKSYWTIPTTGETSCPSEK